MMPGGFKNMNADKIIQCILVAMLKLEKIANNDLKNKLDRGGYNTGTAQTLYDTILLEIQNRIDADASVLQSANNYTNSKVSTVYKVKGSVANYISLPASGQEIGDVWNLLDTGMNYVWTGVFWDALGTTVDISGKENKSEKNQINGYAGLDTNGKISKDQIPNLLKWGYVTAANGGTRTIALDEDILSIEGSGVISTFTVNLPLSLTEAKEVSITFNVNITNLNIDAGGVIDYVPTSAKTYDTYTWVYEPVGNRWIFKSAWSGDLGSQIANLAEKILLANDDLFAISDSQNSNTPKKVSANDLYNYINNRSVKTISQIRALSGTLPSNNFYTTDLGQEGNWYYDSSDTTSADNTGTILVTSDGKRIKRSFVGAVNIKWFGAKTGGVIDNVIPIQSAINANKDVFVPIGRYYVSASVNILNQTNLTGAGIGSIIYSNGDYPVLVITDTDASIRDMSVTGEGRGSVTNYTTIRPNNNGIELIGNYPTSSKSSVIIENVTLNSLGNAGIYVKSNQSDRFSPTILGTNINSAANLMGIFLDEKAEYSSFSNCAFVKNEYGVINNGGNNNFSGGLVTNNRTGVLLGTGGNDGHSVFTGVAINHNTEYSVHAKDVNFGFLFNACMIYYGDVWIDNSDMIKFNGCDFYTPSIYANNSFKAEFIGNKFTLTPDLYLAHAGQPSQVRWFNNFITDGGTNTTVTNSEIIGNLKVDGLAGTLTRQVVVDADGNLSATGIAPTSSAYTPTLTDVTNITGLTVQKASYIRIGNIINVRVAFEFNISSASVNSQFTITLPINRTAATSFNMGNGSVVSSNTPNNLYPCVLTSGSTSSVTVYFVPTATASSYSGSVSFQYSLLD